jgi:hypothetical protein
MFHRESVLLTGQPMLGIKLEFCADDKPSGRKIDPD